MYVLDPSVRPRMPPTAGRTRKWQDPLSPNSSTTKSLPRVCSRIAILSSVLAGSFYPCETLDTGGGYGIVGMPTALALNA